MVSDVFREYKRGTLRRNKSRFLTHFSSVFLFCIYTLQTSENLLFVFYLFLGGINSEHWEEIGEIINYYMLIFTQFKDSFFHGAAFINCFRILKWTLQENSFFLGYPELINLSVQINDLQTQGVEITLIQCCFNVTTLKQRWANVTSTSCLLGNCLEKYQENIHNWVEGYNLSKITKIYFNCTSTNETSKVTQICHYPKTPLDSCISVLVKLYNIFGYKILTGFCFRRVNKLREFLKKRGRRHIQGLVKRLEWIIFIKIKQLEPKFCKNVPC